MGSHTDVTISAIPHAPNADVKPFLIEQNDNLSTLMQTRNQISETAAPTRSQEGKFLNAEIQRAVNGVYRHDQGGRSSALRAGQLNEDYPSGKNIDSLKSNLKSIYKTRTRLDAARMSNGSHVNAQQKPPETPSVGASTTNLPSNRASTDDAIGESNKNNSQASERPSARRPISLTKSKSQQPDETSSTARPPPVRVEAKNNAQERPQLLIETEGRNTYQNYSEMQEELQ